MQFNENVKNLGGVVVLISLPYMCDEKPEGIRSQATSKYSISLGETVLKYSTFGAYTFPLRAPLTPYLFSQPPVLWHVRIIQLGNNEGSE